MCHEDSAIEVCFGQNIRQRGSVVHMETRRDDVSSCSRSMYVLGGLEGYRNSGIQGKQETQNSKVRSQTQANCKDKIVFHYIHSVHV
jgi:hypothetical protein